MLPIPRHVYDGVPLEELSIDSYHGRGSCWGAKRGVNPVELLNRGTLTVNTIILRARLDKDERIEMLIGLRERASSKSCFG